MLDLSHLRIAVVVESRIAAVSEAHEVQREDVFAGLGFVTSGTVCLLGGTVSLPLSGFVDGISFLFEFVSTAVSEFVSDVVVFPKTSRVVSAFFLAEFEFELDFFFGLSEIMFSMVSVSSSSMLFLSVEGVSSGWAVGLLVTTTISCPVLTVSILLQYPVL